MSDHRRPARKPASRATSSRTSRTTSAKAAPRKPAPKKSAPKKSATSKVVSARKSPSKRPSTSRPTPKARSYKRTWRLPVGRTSTRIRAFMMVMVLLVGVCVARAFQLQAFDAPAFAAEAAEKMQATRELPPTRGSIVDRFGVVLAATEPAFLISVDPDMVQTNGADKRYPMSKRKLEEKEVAPQAVAEILAKHLGGRESDYLETLMTEDSRYEIIAKKVPAATWVAIQADMRAGFDGEGRRPWYGLFATSDPIRTYPQRTLASNVVGFVNGEGVGAAGLEGALNEELTGLPGQEVYDRSTYGRIPLGTNVMTPAQDGADYQLTIDSDLQFFVEQALADGMRNANAATGMAVVMDVNTFEILALANGPSYDSSNPGAADLGDLGNRAVTAALEPGSVQKVLTMAALADQGLVTPETRVVVPGRIASGGGYVRDSFSHGDLKMTASGIMAQSSNIGTILLTRGMDKADFSQYLSDFGLGQQPGSGLPGETSGSLPGPDMADYTRDQISFGQGLSTTAVQMAAAISAAVNGGTYQQPTVIKSATNSDGTAIEIPERESRRVISEEASKMTVEMMEAVITEVGNGSRTIPGYRTAGKSGTSQRFDQDCMCYNGYTASFVGVAPAEDPQLLVYVILDEPRNGNLGSRLALPVVNNILGMALPRYNILPSVTPAPEYPLTYE